MIFFTDICNKDMLLKQALTVNTHKSATALNILKTTPTNGRHVFKPINLCPYKNDSSSLQPYPPFS